MARNLSAIENCAKENNVDWTLRHTEDTERLVEKHMPSGSGVDNGTHLDFDHSTPNKLVFNSAYHTMNDNGYYTEWIDFNVIVIPNLGFDFDFSPLKRRLLVLIKLVSSLIHHHHPDPFLLVSVVSNFLLF